MEQLVAFSREERTVARDALKSLKDSAPPRDREIQVHPFQVVNGDNRRHMEGLLYIFDPAFGALASRGNHQFMETKCRRIWKGDLHSTFSDRNRMLQQEADKTKRQRRDPKSGDPGALGHSAAAFRDHEL